MGFTEAETPMPIFHSSGPEPQIGENWLCKLRLNSRRTALYAETIVLASEVDERVEKMLQINVQIQNSHNDDEIEELYAEALAMCSSARELAAHVVYFTGGSIGFGVLKDAGITFKNAPDEAPLYRHVMMYEAKRRTHLRKSDTGFWEDERGNLHYCSFRNGVSTPVSDDPVVARRIKERGW